MFKKAARRGRSERGDEAYSSLYAEPLSDARTKLADFFNILLAATGMHLQMWIFAKPINADQPAISQSYSLQRFAFFRSTVAAGLPTGSDDTTHLFRTHA